MANSELSTPTVSIGLPVYNGARYLREAVESVLAQTFTDFELVICDNASTDETETICRELARADTRIRYFRHEQNLGAARNFNSTFEHARGRYFKWFAHDDLLEPEYLERCVEVLDREPPSVVLCFPRVRYIDEHGNFVPEERARTVRQVPLDSSFDRISFGRLVRLPPSCFPILVFGLARSEAMRRTRLMGGFIMADLITVAELRLVGELVEIPQELFLQRIYSLEPTRLERNELSGEAAWFDPANRDRRQHPYAKLVWEYGRAIHRLGSGPLEKAAAYTAIAGFLGATAARVAHERFWGAWSRLSVAMVAHSGRMALPLRLWAAIGALRRLDLRRLLDCARRPWTRAPLPLLLFATTRLARRNDPSAMNLLVDWLRSIDPDRRLAAAAAVAAAPESFRPRIAARIDPGSGAVEPNPDALLGHIGHRHARTLEAWRRSELDPASREALEALLEHAQAWPADRSETASRSSQVPLLVVIVNYRTPDLTIDCLRSLAPEIPSVPGARTVVVDNGSQDGSADRIDEAIQAQGWSSWCCLRAMDDNLGFAAGNNRGWELFPEADHVLLLNSDTLVHPGALTHCWKRMMDDPSIGALSCKLLNADGSIQNVTRRFPSPLRMLAAALGLPWKLPRWFAWADVQDLGWDREHEQRDVDWLGGAFLMLRGELVRRIGLLDEDFFFYGEDIEFCHRVWKAGYHCHYDPTVAITHLGGQSSDETRMRADWRTRQRWRGRYLVQRKCYGRFAELVLRAIDLCTWGARVPLRRLRYGWEHPASREASDVLRLLREGP